MTDTARVICPCCDNRFDTGGPDEPVCPCCGWEFVADGDGFVTDDGDLDREPLYTLNDDGEPDAEGLFSLHCPYCAHRIEVSEPGVGRCPWCRRTVPVNDWGEVDDETTAHCLCPCGEGVLQACSGAEDAQCLVCGRITRLDHIPPDPDGEPCPNCDWGGDEDDDYGMPIRLSNGRARCPHCDYEYDLFPRNEDDDWFEGPAGPPEDDVPEEEWHTVVVAADGSGDFASISAARESWSWRKMCIVVRPGRYVDRFTCRGDTLIVADGPPGSVQVVSPQGPCLSVNVAMLDEVVRLVGLTLTVGEGAAPVVNITEGRCFLNDCTIDGGGAVGLHIDAPSARAHLRRCRIVGCGQPGALVEERGLATLDECVLDGTGAEVLAGGRLRLTRCRIARSVAEGVCLRRDAEARLQDCVIEGSAGVGVAADQAHVRLERCRVTEGASVGLGVVEAAAVLDDCTLERNAGPQLAVRLRGRAVVRDGRIEGGILATGRSRLLLEDCAPGSHGGSDVVLRGGSELMWRSGPPLADDCGAIGAEEEAQPDVLVDASPSGDGT
jgi:hypothetical protein